MAIAPILSARRRRVHPIAVELFAVLVIAVPAWSPVILWAAQS